MNIVIAGAGLVGCAIAEALVGEGHRMALVDRGAPGSGASGAAMGHVVALDDSEAQLSLCAYGQQVWRERHAATALPGGLLACGTLWVAEDAEQLGVLRAKAAGYAAHGIAAELLSPDELRRAEPNLRLGLAGGLRVPGDFVVEPRAVVMGMVERLARDGVEIISGDAVLPPVGPPEGVTLTSGRALRADLVINALGSDAAILSPELPIRPRKGQLAATAPAPGFVRHQIVELGYLKSAHAGSADPSVAFNVQPRPDGSLVVGSSRHYDQTSAEVDDALMARMVSRASEFLPSLPQLSVVRRWTGVRAATPDKVPIIGPSTAHPNVWIATGHEGLGITSALATARLTADLLAGRKPAIDAAPFLPARFKRPS